MNTVNFGVRDNLSRWTGVVDVRDNVFLNFELLAERGHFQNDFYTGRFQSMSELKSLQ